jgi:N-methylhydantoinase A
MTYQFGIDIGGTFTDLFVYNDEDGTIVQEKVSTTPDEFSDGFINVIQRAFDEHGITPSEIDFLAHATTVATNAILEREGVATGLITTDGFRDTTAIGREDRRNVYELSPAKVPTFTRRQHRIGVDERIAADGTVVAPLDETDAIAAAERLGEEVESVAVSLLHSYRNDEHEKRVRELVTEHTELSVSLSSEVMPEIREYERTLSTVINAYVGPIVTTYIESLNDRLADRGVDTTLHLMQASGGVVTPENLDGRSLRLINSGPAAGVIGAREFAATAGFENIITLDMGGTSADACVVRDGEMETTTEGELDEIPLLFPQVDVRAVGAGGGSIAWLDPANVLKIGPKSAGADPGPACYGRGGSEPTVTDAAVLLGYLNPDYFLGGEMSLDVDAAEDAIATLEAELGRDTVELADGILDIAATNMTQAIRLVTVEKGYDPRNFVLTCYGGAGPLFATRLAKTLDIDRTLIPPAPGVLSASGLLAANKKFNFSRSNILRIEPAAVDEMAAIYEELERAAGEVDADGFDHVRSVDLRYEGQTSKLNVALPDGPLDADLVSTVIDSFHAQYDEIYGHSLPDEAVEGITWRLQLTKETSDIGGATLSDQGTVEDALKTRRRAYAGSEFREFDVYDRYALPAGARFDGPAVVEETESTTVIDDESSVTVGESGSLIIEVE